MIDPHQISVFVVSVAVLLALGLIGGGGKLVKHDQNQPWAEFLSFYWSALIHPPRRFELPPAGLYTTFRRQLVEVRRLEVCL